MPRWTSCAALSTIQRIIKTVSRRASAKEQGIKTLKIGYNKVFGYYIEVSKSYTSLVPDDYVRKQTLTTGERYITDELKDMEATILGARDKLSSLEYDIFCGLRDRVSERAAAIAADAEVLLHGSTCSVRLPLSHRRTDMSARR